MKDVKPPIGLPGTATFQLGILGKLITDRFAAEIERYDLKPKHVGLLTALSHGTAAPQQELAARLGVVPSLVVALADHLERLGAISRVRDSTDRRRQILTLTDEGRRLLDHCEAAAHEIDDQLLAPLPAPERTTLHAALGLLMAHAGPSWTDE